MSEENIILYEVKNKYATITLNRPYISNSFNVDLMKELYNKLIEADKDESVKCILLKSTGNRSFSTGIDLKSADPEDVKYMEDLKKNGRKITQMMMLMKKPIVCQVQGTAIGFGMELIMASDFRIFADRPIEEMFFRMPEIAISIYPQTGATLLPLLAFGLTYAKNLLLTSDRIGLEALKNLNFPIRIFPADKLELETRKFMKIFSKRMDSFMFLIKSSLNIMNNILIKKCLDIEDECGDVAYQKKSQKELDDFINKLYEKY